MEAGPKQQPQQQQQQSQSQQQQQNSLAGGTGQTTSQGAGPQGCQAQGQQNQDAAATAEAGPVEEGVLLARVHVPELYVSKCLQFPKDQLVWDVKQQCLASLPKVSPFFPYPSILFRLLARPSISEPSLKAETGLEESGPDHRCASSAIPLDA